MTQRGAAQLAQLRIGVVAASISRAGGGVSSAVRGTTKALDRIGLAVQVFALNDRFASDDLFAWPRPSPKVFASWPPRRFGYSPELAAELRAAPLDLVHQNGLWMGTSIAVAGWRRKWNRPTVISPHGMLDPWALNNSAWKKRLSRKLFEDENLAGAACLHALNVEEMSAIRRLGLTNPIAVIPNGVDLPRPEERPPRPAFLGDDGRKILLFLGRLHPKKGVSETIEAWDELRRLAPSIHQQWVLVIAGWDDRSYLGTLRATAAALGLERDIVFPGPLFGFDKHVALASAASFILASHSEGLPSAVLEAWAYAVPVFMTRACNLSAGFGAEAAFEISTNPVHIAKQLAATLSDDAALAAAGQRGRMLVSRDFTWDRIATQINDVYEWLVGGGPRPSTVD